MHSAGRIAGYQQNRGSSAQGTVLLNDHGFAQRFPCTFLPSAVERESTHECKVFDPILAAMLSCLSYQQVAWMSRGFDPQLSLHQWLRCN